MLELLKGPFLVLHFSYFTLMTFLMMLILLSMLMMLFSNLSVIRHLICGNNFNSLLNFKLIFETLWTGARSGLFISMLGKFNRFRYCSYYFGRCSSELAELIRLSFSFGRSTHYSDIWHDFSVTIPRCYKDVYVNSFFPRTTRLSKTPKTFWLLVLTLLPHSCKIASSYLVSVPNYWTWTKGTSPKKISLLVKSS